jgi:hypothetical protein
VLSSAWSSSGALSGTPTNVTHSVAHNDDNMNAKAPIVMANNAICTTIGALPPTFTSHGGGSDLQHIEQEE